LIGVGVVQAVPTMAGKRKEKAKKAKSKRKE
jgi:hypothetical protein